MIEYYDLICEDGDKWNYGHNKMIFDFSKLLIII